ncbi:MAG: FAD-dependent oxidoreductase [Bacillota bacterium]
MKFYQEEKKEIPIIAEVEVLVLGAGPAGFSAAVNAARCGAKTMLIEQSGDVGGVATSGLMSHWTGKTRGGFYEEILERSCDADNRRLINPEKLKTVMLEMLSEEQVKLLLYTSAVEAIVEKSELKGVLIENKSGRKAVMAEVVIDATGDGDIAARAGVPYYKGREENGKMQPMTLMFKVAHVDTKKAELPGSFEDNREVPAGNIQDLAEKHLPDPAGHVLLYKSTLPGVVTCNMTNCIDVDGTKAEDLTKAEYICRSQIEPIVDFLKEFVPGFEECFVISSASYIGVRETRHFKGEYTLTKQDIIQARKFDDWAVTRVHFNFDVHNVEGSGLDEKGVQKHFSQKQFYTIPYRCFVPQNIDNLLLAGRNISGTHLAHSSFRVMPICAKMGQSVGTAAALVVEEGISPRNLDVTKLQQELKKQGVKTENS